jgi:molybdate transport system permease protein
MLTEEAHTALMLSLRISLVATIATLPFAIYLAWILARREFWGKAALSALAHIPLVLPPVVTGYLLLLGFGRNGPIGGFLAEWFGITLAFRWTGAALAAAIMSFPLMLRAIRLAFEAVDPKLEETGATLGLSPLGVFARITLPLALPGILVGAVMGFAKAMGEFGATITFVANIPGETQTIPSAIYALLQIPGQESAAATLVLWALGVSLAAVILSERLARLMARRIGRIGGRDGI